MARINRAALVVLAVATFTQCVKVLAFQPKISILIKTWQSVARKDTVRSTPMSTSGSHVSMKSASKQTTFFDERDPPDFGSFGDISIDYSCALSRRKAVKGAISLATVASSWQPLKVLALSDEESKATAATQKPFRVLFTIQIDSKDPETLSELEIEVRPDWAPLAADRFRTLVELGFYKDAPFFRVLPGYVAQFGISADPKLNKQWVYCDKTNEETKQGCQPSIPDEPRTQPNKKGTLSFASSGKNSRNTQIFINLANNDGPPNFLDVQNFVPFARIVRGMDAESNIPKRLNSEYGGKVNQGKAAYYGGEYFQAVFPKLSVIRDTKLL